MEQFPNMVLQIANNAMMVYSEKWASGHGLSNFEQVTYQEAVEYIGLVLRACNENIRKTLEENSDPEEDENPGSSVRK